MKTAVKSFICACAIITSVAFHASAEDKETKRATGFGTGIYTTKAGKINVLVEKVNNEAKTTLLLKNHKGEVVYREVIQKGLIKFGRTLNVNDLEAGQYQIDVISNGETQSKTFQVTEQKTERVLHINL